MAALSGNTITANGTYEIPAYAGRWALTLSDDFGSGSMAINWLDDDDNANAYDDSPTTVALGLDLVVPNSNGIQLVLSGATSPNIVVSLKEVN
jgi:hypothetical protein